MAITELQREVINLVVQRFLDLRQPTSLEQVLRKYRDEEASGILNDYRFFQLVQGGYAPKPFAFESCGNGNFLIQARQTTKVALQILQNLEETYQEKQGAFKFLEFVNHAAKMFDPTPDRSVLTLGFFLAWHFNVFSQITQTGGRLEDSGDQTSFVLATTKVIMIDPTRAWDEHIASIRSGPVSARKISNQRSISQLPDPDLTIASSSTTKEQCQNLRVFLCHSSQDKASVRKLYERLSRDGFAPWLDEENLIAGQDWQQEITKAVRMCHFVLVCLSASSVTKEGFVQKEIKIALDVADEKPEGTIFIIPVRLQEGVTVPTRLGQWQWVNLFDAGGYGQLVRALNTRSREIHTVTGRAENERESTDQTNKVSDHFLALEQLAGQLVEELSSYRPLDRTILTPWFEEFRRTPGQFVRYPEIRACVLKLQNVLDRMFVAKRGHQDDQHELRSELDAALKALLTACDQARKTTDNERTINMQSPLVCPKIRPASYGVKTEKMTEPGLVVANDGEPAYNISIPDIEVGRFKVHINPGLTRLSKEDGKHFCEVSIWNPKGALLPGEALLNVMHSENVGSITFVIRFADSDGKRYVATCRLELEPRMTGGLTSLGIAVRFIKQEIEAIGIPKY